MNEEFESLVLAFESADTKLWEVLTESDEELVRRVKRSVNEIRRFRDFYVSQIRIEKTSKNQSDLQPLSTGIPKLDEFLGGGLYRRSVTEISGAAGAGKTCLCCQIALSQRKNNVVYFSLEDNIATLLRRMQSIDPNANFGSCRFARVSSVAELRRGLSSLKKSEYTPSVVIIDSIVAALASSPPNEIDVLLEELALQKAAYEMKAAFVIVNQVRDSRRPIADLPMYHYNVQEMILEGDASPYDELRKRPVYGVPLSKHISTRILLFRPLQSSAVRKVSIVYSKYAPSNALNLTMRNEGLVYTEEAEGFKSPPHFSSLPRSSQQQLTPRT